MIARSIIGRSYSSEKRTKNNDKTGTCSVCSAYSNWLLVYLRIPVVLNEVRDRLAITHLARRTPHKYVHGLLDGTARFSTLGSRSPGVFSEWSQDQSLSDTSDAPDHIQVRQDGLEGILHGVDSGKLWKSHTSCAS